MMKRIGWILVAMVLPLCAAAQTPVAVTATVTGANGAPYAYGTWQAQLVNSSGVPLNNAFIGPTQFLQTLQNGTLSSTGSLSVNLYANSAFYPTGTQWAFNICSQNTSASPTSFGYIDVYQQCYQSLVTITTAGSYSTQISTGAPAIYPDNYQTGSIYANTVYLNGGVGAGAVAFTAGAAAGTAPGTPTCTSGHVCDTITGIISFTMGTSTTTGIVLTITITPTTLRANQGNCDGAMYLVASPYTAIPVRFTETTAPTTYVVNVGTAPTASTAYEIAYQCGGN